MDNSVQIKILAQAEQAAAEIKKIGDSVSGLSQKLDKLGTSSGRLSSTIGEMGHLAAAFYGVTQAAQGLSSVAATLDKFSAVESRLRLVTSSANDLALTQTKIFEIAQRNRVGYADLADTYARMANSTKELGISQARLLNVTDAVSKAIAISGGSAESARAAMVQLGQGLASGTLRGEELNSVLEQTPRLAQAIAQGMGVSVGQLRKLGEEGRLTAQNIVGALERAAPQLASEFAKVTPTISSAFQVLSDSAGKAMSEFDKGAGASAKFSKVLLDLAGSAGDAAANMRSLGESFAPVLNIAAAAAGVTALAGAVGLLATRLAGLAKFAANPLTITVTLAVAGFEIGKVLEKNSTFLNWQLRGAEKDLTELQGLKARGMRQGEEALFDGLDRRIAAAEARVKILKRDIAGIDKKSFDTINASSQEAREALRQSERDIEEQAKAPLKRAQQFIDARKAVSQEMKEALDAERAEFRAATEGIAQDSEQYTRMLEATKRREQEIRKKFAKKEGTTTDKDANEYKRLIESAKEYQGQLESIAANGEGMTQAETMRAKAIALVGEKQYEANRALFEGNVAIEESNRIKAESAKAEQDRISGLKKTAESLAEQVEKSRLENEELGLTIEQLDALKLARLDAAIVTKEQALATLESGVASAAEVQAILHQIDALRELRAITTSTQFKQENQRAIDSQQKAWENFSRDIEQSLTDALMRSFEAGESFGEAFKKNLENVFRTMIVKAAVQITVGTVMQGASSLLGTNTAPGTSGSGTASANSLLQYGNLLNNGNAAYYNAFSSFAGSSVGQSFGLSTAMGPPTEAGAYGMTLTGTGTMVQDALPYLGSVLSAAQGNWTSAILSAIGTYFGGPVGGLVGNLVGGLFGGGSKERFKTTIGSSMGSYDDGRFTDNGIDAAWTSAQGGRVFGTEWDAALAQVSQIFASRVGGLFDTFGLEDSIDTQLYTRLRRTSGGVQGMFNADLDGAAGPDQMALLFSGEYGEDGEVQSALAALINDLFTTGIKKAVAASDLPDLVKEVFEPLTKADDIEAAIRTISAANEMLKSEGTNLAEYLGSSAESYLRGEENLLGMIDRTITALASINPVLEDLGMAAYDLTLAGGDAAGQLSALFGNLEGLMSATSAYYQEFFSEQERLDNLSRKLGDAFSGLNIEMPATHEEFRALVDALDLTTEAGRETFASLMGLAPAFDVVADAAAKAAEDALKAAQTAQRAALDNVDNAFAGVERAIEAQRAAQQAALDVAQDIADRALRITASLADASRKLRGEDAINDISLAGARRSIGTMIDAARGGSLPDEDTLARTLGILTGDTPDRYATQVEYELAQRRQAAQLDTLAELIGNQGKQARTTAELAQEQLDALDAQLEWARVQVDALNGIDTSVKSVAEAIAALTAAISGAKTGTTGSTSGGVTVGGGAVFGPGGTPSAPVPVEYWAPSPSGNMPITDPAKVARLNDIETYLRGTYDGTDAWLQDVYTQAQTYRVSQGEISIALGIPITQVWEEFDKLGIPRFAVGTNYVPQDMLAQVHQGERIIPAADNRALLDALNGGGNVIDIRPLLDEVRLLRSEVQAVAGHTGKTSRLIERVMPDGDAIATREVAA